MSSFTNRKDFGKGARRQLVPVATVLDYAGATAPDGYLLCDGSVVRREDYNNLFKVISTTYNTGGEAGYQFRLPDLRGRVSVGVGTDGTAANAVSRALAANGGDTRLQTHTHGVSGNTSGGGAHSHQVSTTINGDWAGISTGAGEGGWAVADSPGYNNNTSHLYAAGVGDHTHPISLTSSDHNQSVGTGQNMPPFVTLNKIIKT